MYNIYIYIHTYIHNCCNGWHLQRCCNQLTLRRPTESAPAAAVRACVSYVLQPFTRHWLLHLLPGLSQADIVVRKKKKPRKRWFASVLSCGKRRCHSRFGLFVYGVSGLVSAASACARVSCVSRCHHHPSEVPRTPVCRWCVAVLVRFFCFHKVKCKTNQVGHFSSCLTHWVLEIHNCTHVLNTSKTCNFCFRFSLVSLGRTVVHD